MTRFKLQDAAAVVLALVLAAPPVWWAGEAFAAARDSVAMARR